MVEDDGPQDERGEEEKGIPLIDSVMLGRLLFPFAMAEAQRVPPANDREAARRG